MRHEHLSVTVDAGTKDRIDDHLGRGESLEAWVADAIARKLDEESASDDGGVKSDDEEHEGTNPSDDEERTTDSDGDEDEDDYDEGFEYVDDCAI